MISFIIGFAIGSMAGIFTISLVSVSRDDGTEAPETDKEANEEIE